MAQGYRTVLAVLCFDTAEFLPYILGQTRGLTDGVMLCLPYTSWEGELPPLSVERDVVRAVAGAGASLYRPDIRFSPSSSLKRREILLRNMILERAEEDGYDYILLCDDDEIYSREEFGDAMETVLSKGLYASYCRYTDYWKWPDVELCGGSGGYVPFFQKCDTRYSRRTSYMVRVDDTRKVIFDYDDDVEVLEGISMMHLSWIRSSMSRKMRYWPSCLSRAETRAFVKAFDAMERPRAFGVPFSVPMPGGEGVAVRVRGSRLKKIIE